MIESVYLKKDTQSTIRNSSWLLPQRQIKDNEINVHEKETFNVNYSVKHNIASMLFYVVEK